MQKKLYMDYALRNNKLVHVDSVPNGLACNCSCPYCGEHLIARQGKKQVHHFAHKSGSDCKYGYETSLHLLAKEILSEAKYFTIPPVEVKMESHNEIIYPSQDLKIINVTLEKKLNEDQIIPDVILEAAFPGNRTSSLLIEIFVTHKINDEKKAKLIAHELPTIEIDLSEEEDLITREYLQEILLENSDRKKWIYNRKASKRVQYYWENSLTLTAHKYNDVWYVNGCPRARCTYNNNNYSHLDIDCKKCIDCLSISKEDDQHNIHVHCLAHIIHDNQEVLNKATDLNFHRHCPICGEKLNRLYIGLEKAFLKCPNCSFMTKLYENNNWKFKGKENRTL